MVDVNDEAVSGTETKRPSWWLGAIIGGLLTAPLTAVLFVGEQAADLPFVPFDFFDWLARVLPGDVIRFGINLIVDVIEAFNLGETSSAAKTLEQIQGILFVVGIGAAVGALVFMAARRWPDGVYRVGMLGGFGLGVAFALIHGAVRSASEFVAQAGALPSAVWIVALYSVWGLALAWAYRTLNEPYFDDSANSVKQIGRRQFLVQVGGMAASVTVIGAGAGALLNLSRSGSTRPLETLETAVADLPEGLPNADAAVQPVPGTRPEYTPIDEHYRIDISARPPNINGETYRLRVHGLVQTPLEISLPELLADYEPVDSFVTMSCISNRIAGDLISTTRWTGIPFHLLLDDWGLTDDATHLRLISADGFDEWVEIDLIRRDPRVMLCYAWDGKPLTARHGFPLRIHIPDLYGMKQPKWITEIEVTDSWGEGYWVARRWDAAARVQPVSVIDTVAVNAAEEHDGQIMIPVGGIAYSGAKGISRVQVSVNDGEWQDAQLRDPLSDTTWVLWRFMWPFEAGQHRFQVRCYTAEGNLQPTQVRGVFPSGATGVHTVTTQIDEDMV